MSGWDSQEDVAVVAAPEGRAWLEQAVAAVAADPTAVRAIFPAVGRHVGRGPVSAGPSPAGGVFGWSVDDAARAVLLDALGERVGGELDDLYRHGDSAERRAVLRWIGRLGEDAAAGPRPVPARALNIVEDALRSNDPRLVAAALGPWAVRHLDGPALRQGVLKCVFLGVPLAGLHGLEERSDPELARMLAGYVHERVAAGRSVPDDVWPLIDAHPPVAELAAITAELDHAVPERRQAAVAALDARMRGGHRS